MYDDTEQKKPIFSDPPDQRITNMNNILSNIQKQQAEIMKLLYKYKQVIPDDQDHFQAQQSKQKNKNNQLNKYKRQAKTKNNQIIKIQDTLIQKQTNKNKKLSKSGVVDQSVRISNTISYQNSIAKDIEQNRKSVKLPSVGKKQTKSYSLNKNKEQKDRGHLSARQSLQQSKIRLYETYNKNKIIALTNLKSQQKIGSKIYISNNQHNQKYNNLDEREEYANNNNQWKQAYNASSNSYPHGLKKGKKKRKQSKNKPQQNIFDNADAEEQDLQIGLQAQIAKPIPYRPYEDMKMYDKPSSSYKQDYSRASSTRVDDDDKSMSVSLTFYMRNFNEKIKQQCQQQINYLYFSRAEQNDSNKEWALQIMKMFDKHNDQLNNLHKNMRYLQTFDQGFFSAGIYQNSNQSPNRSNKL